MRNNCSMTHWWLITPHYCTNSYYMSISKGKLTLPAPGLVCNHTYLSPCPGHLFQNGIALGIQSHPTFLQWAIAGTISLLAFYPELLMTLCSYFKEGLNPTVENVVGIVTQYENNWHLGNAAPKTWFNLHWCYFSSLHSQAVAWKRKRHLNLII